MAAGKGRGQPRKLTDAEKARLKADPVPVFGRVLRLQFGKADPRGWVHARCPNPSHEDNDPSFGVGPDGECKCISCGLSGDVFKVIETVEGIDHATACARIAEAMGTSSDTSNYRESTKPRSSKSERPPDPAQMPVPSGAGKPPKDKPKVVPADYSFGQRWAYKNPQGRVLLYRDRWNGPDPGDGSKPKKTFSWRTYRGGKWTALGISPGRECKDGSVDPGKPIYGQERLAAEPEATVLVVEGEKAADSTILEGRGLVLVAPADGAQSPHTADWSPLAGRNVVVLGDHLDDAEFSPAVARGCLEAGAASVRIAKVSERLRDSLPKGWDIADGPPPDERPFFDDEILRWIKDAVVYEDFAASADIPHGYELRDGGLFHEGQRISSWVKVVAQTRTATTGDWGRVIEFLDHDGKRRTWAFSDGLLEDGKRLREQLRTRGLDISNDPKHGHKLREYIANAVGTRATAVSKTGWYEDVFVLPDEVIGNLPEGGEVYPQLPTASPLRTAGKLTDWQREVCQPCDGNSRLMLAVALAFAGPLLRLAKIPGGGINFYGRSSTGKSTTAEVAGSVWGRGEESYLVSWNATKNGLEGVSVAHNDTLLCLDEIGEVDAREVGKTLYMLSNGQGRTRSKDGDQMQQQKLWRLFVLSTGESRVPDVIEAAGQRVRGGQAARVVDIQAVVSEQYGIFQRIDGYSDAMLAADPAGCAGAFSRRLVNAARRYYGTAGRQFLRKLIEQDRDVLVAGLEQSVAKFVERNKPNIGNGEVTRVAQMFGLICMAGEMAADWGIVTWNKADVGKAVADAFHGWVADRRPGSTDAIEARRSLIAHLQANAGRRFQPFQPWDQTEAFTYERDGFRRETDDGDEFYIFTNAFKRICGSNYSEGARLMAERGELEVAGDGKTSVTRRLPGMGPTRVYLVKPSLLSDG